MCLPSLLPDAMRLGSMDADSDEQKIKISVASASLRAARTARKGDHDDANTQRSRTAHRPVPRHNEQTELAIVRRAYAKHVLANVGVDDARVEAAFAAVRREHFLGPGPWPMPRWSRPDVPTPSDDPVYLYQDALVGIAPERNLNNGQPSLHTLLIAASAPQPGEHVVHIGAGVGYYTAILAHMVARAAGSRRSNSMAASPSAWQRISPGSPMCMRCKATVRRSSSI